ncbi:hypothetical protein COV05_04880 [Candidatus Uhrbacteria bacterium CG10_big_fil_rev_8_21_14_0_10_48_16]|uniref:DUF3048 domain-containing protein n=1 Tax=Candidatus Uhrbacteria bacterium CG10_big_fil_rev_8_21_14_0_10_48_16 TaxID=1975038 RepID=A0A2M8LFW1_9BACT|nr:MAG: hypothetical protein COV05_04880 [Candidatus Uhrbacteria bacterium CG10_big_fil_rev_8_21_14_0_10_48_16]
MSQSQTEETRKIKKADQPLLVGLLVVFILVLLVVAVLPKFVYRLQSIGEEGDIDSQELLYRHPLTGVLLYEEVAPPQIYSVMIDNHEDAWPPSGIDQAFLVIEAPVEAGISRMLAFFSEEQDVEEIGPVRSARPYYLDWASELDALYAHVGGSPEALDLIASGGTFDMNQYWWGEYFWRENGTRYAPHNVFTSSDDLNQFFHLREEAGATPTRLYDTWMFKDPEPSQEEGKGVFIDFWAPVYVVDWEYNQETNLYERSQFREPHVVTSGAQIMADNVVVVITDVSIIDSVGRREIRTIGEGDGYVFQDGRVIEVTWKKPSASERLKFYDRTTDEEIIMNAGVTWIEIVPNEDDISIE